MYKIMNRSILASISLPLFIFLFSSSSNIDYMSNEKNLRPSNAFIGVSWVVLFAGIISYIAGLWNASMELNEKGYYFTVLILGLFAVISLQKAVRDQLEGIPVTSMYHGLSWAISLLSVLLLIIGLWNADLMPSEKGFYAMSFVLSLFAAIAVQKNVRDAKLVDDQEPLSNPNSGLD